MTKPESAPDPSPPPAVPPAQTGTEPAAAGQATKRLEVRNVLTLTFVGVVIVLGALIGWHYVHEYNRPKRELRTEMMAPNIQTDPAGNPLQTGEWYLKRGREALNRKDTSTCRMMLDDLHDMVKKNHNALSPDAQKQMQALEEDLQQALAQ
ncbi:MAG TPA: hypothetical protein VL860_10090 [Planctomycetota bacterium]|nr:hypothetical protein [Planctomycetota bacterium]